jgi:transcription-repair coupling factor (superfamily II helicase)
LFSDEYINNISERLSLYSELGTKKNEEELKLFQIKLIDRFGPMPPRAIALMNSIRISGLLPSRNRETSAEARQNDRLFCDQQSDYYQSKRFMSVMDFVQKTKFNL